MTYSNPRTYAMIEDWPIGRQRCRARFELERTKRGERVLRWTENKSRTGWNKPKATTYAGRCAIVDGDDGRIYILQSTLYGFINVLHGTLKGAEPLHKSIDPQGYSDACQLLHDCVDTSPVDLAECKAESEATL